MMPCVYILKGKRYYIGSTNNLVRRMKEHYSGKTQTTRRIGNFDLVKVFFTETMEEARELEKRIKRSGHTERWL